MSKKENVGYENAGALIWGYGEELYRNKALVNQEYDEESDQFIGGQIFDEIVATALVDNIGSCKILKNLGFGYVGKIEKYDAMRYELSLNFNQFDSIELTAESSCAVAAADASYVRE